MNVRGILARAPGRVNLIGEHTDYNDGFVMPAAIGYETHVTAFTRPGYEIRLASAAYARSATFDVRSLETAPRRGDWSDYAIGVLRELDRAHVPLGGAHLAITSTVPLGAGLSSSAAFEVALALAILGLARVEKAPLELAALAQRAEYEGTGMRCGIMDQVAVLLGRAGCATLLDTRSLDVRYVAVPPGAAIVICNSMVRHALASGEYNKRRDECEAAVAALQRWNPDIRALRDVSMGALREHRAQLPPLLYRRARHVVSENERVLATAAALESGDLAAVGAAMYASHESLRSDFEVSCGELDLLVSLARNFAGTYGARMTGGGFGGCTVNLVEAAVAGQFRAHISRAYHARTGIVPDTYDGTPVNGASAGPPQ